MNSINISFEKKNNDSDDLCFTYLKKFGFKDIDTTNKHQNSRLKNNDLTMTFFNKKIQIQGKKNPQSLIVLEKLHRCENLSLDTVNLNKYKSFFPSSHNSIICGQCNKDKIFSINGNINEKKFFFTLDCGHNLPTNLPLNVRNSRILPDISVLFGGILSKCIEYGHFNKFEIVIPTFILDVVDILHKSKKRKAVGKELERLKKLESNDKISIFNCPYANPIKNKEVLEDKEDDIIIKLANLTNSIIFTGDFNMKSKTLLANKPTIYLDPEFSKELKELLQTY